MTITTTSEPHQPLPGDDHRTLFDLFLYRVQTQADRIALRFFDATFTWQQLDTASDSFAGALQRNGFAKGDRIAIQMQNCPQFVIAILGIWKAQAVVVPIGPMYRVEETHTFLTHAGVRGLITHPELWNDVGQYATRETDVSWVCTTDYRDLLPVTSHEAAPITRPESSVTVESFTDILAISASVAPDTAAPVGSDLAIIAFTSGTTGGVKGSYTTHRNLSFASTNWIRSSSIDQPENVLLSLAPYVHITGIVGNISAWIASGCEMVQMHRFDPLRAIDLLAQHRVTWMVGAATVYIAMLQAAPQRPDHSYAIRSMLSGGAPIPSPLVDGVKNAFGADLSPGWGMTETTTLGTTTPYGQHIRQDTETGVISVGIPSPGVCIRIIDDTGQDVPARTHGEVLISGPNVIDRYWNQSAETTLELKNGWLHTGDVGFLDEDGWLYLVDRTKNMIIASGYKVWPREVEEVLCRFPGVREAAVIGAPDAYRGETVRAFISADTGEHIDVERITAFCREHLASYKVPRIVSVIDDIPKNTNGKVMRDALTKIAE